jgi:hypothetical protein
MNEKTLSALSVLEKADWFTRVGCQDTEVAVVLRSWQDALKRCTDYHASNWTLEAKNQYCRRLDDKAQDKFQEWNNIVRELRPGVTSLVTRKSEVFVKEHQAPPPFVRIVHNAVLRACMELEYADVEPPGFFAGQIYWYVKGHFPCDWKGVEYRRPKYDRPGGIIIATGIDLYPAGFYDPIARWYETGFGDWQGQIPPPGKLIVY